jgi:hypothetical protein
MTAQPGRLPVMVASVLTIVTLVDGRADKISVSPEPFAIKGIIGWAEAV